MQKQCVGLQMYNVFVSDGKSLISMNARWQPLYISKKKKNPQDCVGLCLFLFCVGKHVDSHHLHGILGCAAGLQPVL